MEQVMTNVFDRLTVEELDDICPGNMTTSLDPEILCRIRNRVMDRLKSETAKKKEDIMAMHVDVRAKKRKSKILLIAAIIAILATVSAVAVSLGGGRFLADLFGQKNYSIVEQYVLTDLAEASDGKLNLTLESALSDGHYYFVVFSISTQDGSNLEDRFPDAEFTYQLEKPSRVKPGFQLERLQTEDTTESCAYYIALIHSSQSVINSMKMEITRMFAYDGSVEDIPASLEVEADFTTCPLAVGGDEDVFRSIELSPFGLWIDVYEDWETDDSLSAGVPIYDVFLLFEDGSQVGARAEQFADPDSLEKIGWGGTQLPNGTHQSYISIRFSQFVDIDNVKAVIINGREFPLQMSEK